MKTYKDINYLSGHLNIVINEEHNIVIGKLIIYDYYIDDFLNFKAIAVCSKSDSFNENIGINIVKLKLAKQYYSYRKNESRKEREEILKILKNIDNDYNYSNKKLTNIKKSLQHYGLNFKETT